MLFLLLRLDGCKNEDIRNELDQVSITPKREEKQLKWLGSVIRMGPNGKAKQIAEMQISNKKRVRNSSINGWNRMEEVMVRRGKL